LGDFDEILWIDNCVVLSVDPSDVFDTWLADADFTAPQHSFRDKVIDEFAGVVEKGRDDPARVWEQLLHYLETWPEVMLAKPLWTGMVARRATPGVANAMRIWADHILRYSRRDQLSILTALALADVSYGAPELDNYDSPLHHWAMRRETGRRVNAPHLRFDRSIEPPLSQLRTLRREASNAETLADQAREETARLQESQDAAWEEARSLYQIAEANRERAEASSAEAEAARARVLTSEGEIKRLRSALRKERLNAASLRSANGDARGTKDSLLRRLPGTARRK
jgi:hypothetical protein